MISGSSTPLVVLRAELFEDPGPAMAPVAAQDVDRIRDASRDALSRAATAGTMHVEFRVDPYAYEASGLGPDDVLAAVHDGLADTDPGPCDARLVVTGSAGDGALRASEVAARWSGHRVAGFALALPASNLVTADDRRGWDTAGEAGLGRGLDVGTASAGSLRETVAALRPDRLGRAAGVIGDCATEGGRVVALGATAASVRDTFIPLEVDAEFDPVDLHRLFDCGFRITAPAGRLDDVEESACWEWAAVAAFAPEPDRVRLVERIVAGRTSGPARLVHLAERDRWAEGRARGSYLPGEWARDGFIHLSARHQLLTPANRFYRGRTDLVALVLDAHLLGSAVVWEPGTGTIERFPHLYGALTPDAVLAEVELTPQADGGFLVPAALATATRSPLGRERVEGIGPELT